MTFPNLSQEVVDLAREHNATKRHKIYKKMTRKEMNELIGGILSEDITTSDGLVLGKVLDKITLKMLLSARNAGIKNIDALYTNENDKCFIQMLEEYPHTYTNFRRYTIGINKDLSYLEGKILFRTTLDRIGKASEIITKPMLARLVETCVKAGYEYSVCAADVVSKEMIKAPFNNQEKPVINPPVLSKTEDVPMKEKTSMKQPRGRPVEHKEEWSKITVVLLDKQIHWLDQLASNIRLNTKSAISRAELIRAIIASIEESGVELSQLKSENEIKDHLLRNSRSNS
jgi:hypothetical protein